MSQSPYQLRGWRKPTEGQNAFADCALIIPTFRRPKEILRLLDLLRQLPDAPGEVLVIDGTPEPEVERAIASWAEQRSLPYVLTYVNSPAGLTRQRNVGIDACQAKYIFFLDDDCLPQPGYFAALCKVFLNDSKKQVGAVRGMLTNGINKPLTWMWRLRFGLRVQPRGEPGRYYPCGSSGTWDMVPPFSGVRPVDVLAGGASAYRREVFDRHRFSEFFYGYAQGEDLEMSLRIGRDWKLLACGDALVHHNHAEGGRPAGFPRGRMAVRNRYFIWKRHSPSPGLLNQLRFWADHALIITYNMGVFLLRPWRPYNLLYAVGTLLGAIGCLITPPAHSEPIARREYDFIFQEFSGIPRKREFKATSAAQAHA